MKQERIKQLASLKVPYSFLWIKLNWISKQNHRWVLKMKDRKKLNKIYIMINIFNK